MKIRQNGSDEMNGKIGPISYVQRNGKIKDKTLNTRPMLGNVI
jgi:hypothetical protein